MTTSVEIGPQYRKDPPFRARMRFHQSWWRAEVLKAPHGVGPTPKGGPLGSCLAEEPAAAGQNFLTPQIHEVARERIAEGGGVEAFRCTRNLLSSQPMCFNLFAPLKANLELAKTLLSAVLPQPISEVTDVRIEYAPTPSNEYVGDRSAFDAYIEYIGPDGEPGFVGIETKLTEPFSSKHYPKSSRARYVELTDAVDAPWTDHGRSVVDSVTTNQLWRNHLLVEAVRKHPENPHGRRGRLAVVHHPLDEECSAAIASYRSLLAEPDESFLDWRLDRLMQAWRPLVDGEDAVWLERFSARYVDLSGSEDVWAARAS